MPGSSEHLHKLVCIGLARFLATSYRTATRFEVAFLRTDGMLIDIDTNDGLKKIRVCDYCRTVCIPYGQFCSSRCYHRHLDVIADRQESERERQLQELKEWEAKRNGR